MVMTTLLTVKMYIIAAVIVVAIVIILVTRIGGKSDNVIDVEARTWTLSCCPLGFSSKSLPRMSSGL